MSFTEVNPQRSVQHPRAFDLCVCSMPRWRHPPTEADLKKFYPYHLFTEPDLGDNLLILRRDERGRFLKVEKR